MEKNLAGRRSTCFVKQIRVLAGAAMHGTKKLLAVPGFWSAVDIIVFQVFRTTITSIS